MMTPTLTDMARLIAEAAPHSSDWLHALLITAVGLRLSDEAIRVAVSYRLGCATRQPHSCDCSAMVDKTGLHGLSCKKSVPRHIRHAQLNYIIWRAVKRAQYLSVMEPVGLSWSDGKRPDGATLIPWTRGKPLAWDIIVADTYAIRTSITQQRERRRRQTEQLQARRSNTQSFPRSTTSLQLQ